MRKFHLMSDIHIDLPHRLKINSFTNLAKIYPAMHRVRKSNGVIDPYNFSDEANKDVTLLLAGDIGNAMKDNYYDFLKDCANYYKDVVFITGNHEYYNELGFSMEFIDNMIEKRTIGIPNLHFLQKKSIILNSIRFIGCTMWSRILPAHYNSVSSLMNDYKLICIKPKKLITPLQITDIHIDHVKWLEGELASDTMTPTIVLTHHLPSKQLSHEKYEKYSHLNSAFFTDLEHLQQNNVRLWQCGHTHTNMEININETLYIVNPFGYDRECDAFYMREIEI
jgi:predicted phosphodiesterase